MCLKAAWRAVRAGVQARSTFTSFKQPGQTDELDLSDLVVARCRPLVPCGAHARPCGRVDADNDRRGSLLALGDSVVYGYITADGPAYVNPTNFLGYPEIVGDSLRLDVANASCPGETTSGFLSLTGADNGCRTFRATAPLRLAYSPTKRD